MGRWFWIMAAVSFGIDQFSKWLVVFQWDLKNILYMDVWPGFITFVMGWNRGINFGLFAGQPDAARWILIALALGICVFICVWARKDGRPLAMGFAGLLVGGALANVLDRILYGAVADFLNVTCCGIQNPFSFNLADVFVFAGAIGLVFFADDKKNA